MLALILCSLFALLSYGEVSAENSARQGLEQRFDLRLTTASNFLSDYVAGELKHEASLAEARLTGKTITQSEFDAFAQDFQFGPSLLLNNHGRVLDVIPAEASLIGVDIAPKYSHLTIAETGRQNVSQVVSSAVQHIPVVAFAVPFSTPSGLRVMSGTLQISSGPLGDFLQSTRSIAGSSIYLADMSNRIIASAPAGPIATSLSTTLANLKANSAQTVSGHYEVGYTIAGTPWKIIASLPTAQLFGPIDGVARLVPWLLLGGFALIATILGLVLLVIWERKLTEAAKAGIDPLTGLANRRQLEERTSVLFSASSRHDFDLAVLMIDIDHFKGVNDRFGHQVGDKVLRAVAHCLQACLRTEDVGARWGGEEFVAVLPYTDLAGATHVAERLRALIAATAVEAGSHGTIHVTVSIGVSADAAGTTAAQMIGFADGALYRAKHNGRNCVVQADPSRSASAVGSFDY